MSSVQYDILKQLITKEIHRRRRANKLKGETIITTNTLNILKDDEQYTSLSNSKDKNKKKKKKVSEEKTEIKKLSSNEKQKNTSVDTVHTKMIYNCKIYKCEVCEKLCKSSSSLNKHKAKAHILNGDAVITTYISKHLGDEENTLINIKNNNKNFPKIWVRLNKQVKKMKTKKAYKERNRVKKLSSNEAMIYKNQIKYEELSKVYLENDIDSVHATVACNSETYKCEVCEKSCKSDSDLNKHKVKVHKFNKEILDENFTANISKCLEDTGYKSLLNTVENKIKKRKKKASKEKIPVDNEMINHNWKSICDDIDMKVITNNNKNKMYNCEHCEKSCKSNSSLDKHKSKAHILKKDADFTMTNISKCSVDEVYTSLLNTPEKKIKKKKIASKEKIQVDNEVTSHKRKSICDDINMKKINNNRIYTCEHCEKSCKSNSSLDKHKAKAHILKKDADFTMTNILKCSVDEVYTSLLNTPEKLIKKRKIASKEIIQVHNEMTSHKRKLICDDIGTKVIDSNRIYNCEHCEKSCKSNSSLDKHKAKAHLLKKDAGIISTNISKCSVDKVYTSLLNIQEKRIKKRKKASKEKIQVDNEMTSHKLKRMCVDIDTTLINNNRIYKCEHCEKSCKSNSSLDKHKAKAHLLKKDADYITTNILKRSVDEVYTSLLNTPEKEIKERKKALLLNTQAKKVKKNNTKVRVKTITVTKKTIQDKPKEYSDSIFRHTNESQIGKFYECDICRKLFEFLSALDEHKTNYHVAYVGPYICTFCGKTFENANSLSAHKCIGTGKSLLEFEICNKTYSTKYVIGNHYEKPHICDVCSKPFLKKGYLTKHYRIHTAERPYECDFCGKTFTQKSNLIVHYRIHTGEKPHVCDVCSRPFMQKGDLTKHYRIHTGERPYTCDICGKTFARLYSLTVHYRIHTGEKPYECGICEMSFTTSSGRNKHTRRIHDNCF